MTELENPDHPFPAGNVLRAMVADSVKLNRLRDALIQTIGNFLDRGLPLRRILLVASILKNCRFELLDKEKLIQRILREQKNDGGWVDCEDTAWAIYCLAGEAECEPFSACGIKWLNSEISDGPGWGFCKRDRPCIPITSQILYFLRDISHCTEVASWLEMEWKNDLASPVRLNYKAAWYILAALKKRRIFCKELFEETVMYLVHEQRNDGGWGPWREHPAPSDFFISGICLAALALSWKLVNHGAIIPVLNKGIRWIEKKQLDNGLFPTHYIDEGSAWILFGWTNALETINAYADEGFINR